MMDLFPLQPLPGAMASNHGPSRPRIQQYSKAEWDSMRRIIKELFIDKRLSLKTVMKIMTEEHDFHASRKMYVDHLDSWGFAKNCTKKTIAKLLHQKEASGATDKAWQLREGRWIGAKRVEKYLKRTKQDIGAPSVKTAEDINRKTLPGPNSQSFLPISGTTTIVDDEEHVDNEKHVDYEDHIDYEEHCPFRMGTKKFRLIETFPNNATWQADSPGSHIFIPSDEELPCTEGCYCRQHTLLKDFSFQVQKSTDNMDITFFSDTLYQTLLGYGLKGLRDGVEHQEKSINGLVLLKNYHFLKTQTDAFAFAKCHDTSLTSLHLEMELLVEGLLGDGEVFESFGHEALHERQFLDFKLWKKFQQDKFERDVSALEEGFDEVDDESDDESVDFLASTAQLDPDVVDDTNISPNFCSQGLLPSGLSADGATDSGYDPQFATSLNSCALEIAQAATDDWKVSRVPMVRGSQAYVLRLLDGGLGAISSRHHLSTLLAIAAKAGLEAPVKLLLALGADVNAVSFAGSPLGEAVKAGHEAITRLLLDRGANVEGHDFWVEVSPLRQAVWAGHEAITRLLLDRGANVEGHYFWDGVCLLTEAVRAGNEIITRLLLDQGAKVNGHLHSRAPLIEAAMAGHEAIVRLLLDRGADIDVEEDDRLHFWKPMAMGLNPLVAAARVGHEAIVRLLLDRGANTSLCFLTSPLDEAARAGHEIIVRLLLDRGANIGPCFFTSPLNEAARAGQETIIRLLLDRRANTSPDFLTSLLSKAAKAGQETIVRLLLDRGANTGLGFLTSHLNRVEKFRFLRRKFMLQYIAMTNASQRSSTAFSEVSSQFKSHRDAWQSGFKTLRGLQHNERATLPNIIAYLCLIKAMSEALEITSLHDYTGPFLQDLARWELLLTEEQDRVSYRDAIHLMWGVSLDEITSSHGEVDSDVMERFFSLASVLVSQTNDQFGWNSPNQKGFGRSQQEWKLRNGYIPTVDDVPPTTDPPIPNDPIVEPPEPDIDSTMDPPPQNIIIESAKEAVPNHVVVFLMLSAAFAITLIFLQWLKDTLWGNIWNTPIGSKISTLKERCGNLASYLGLNRCFPVTRASAKSGDSFMGEFFDFNMYGVS